MSDIPKSERTESRLEAQHIAYAVRRRITAELMASFAYSQERQEKHIRKMTEHIKDPSERADVTALIRETEEDFDSWFIMRERDHIADLCRGICLHLRAANTIWPTYMSEFQERRLELDRAMMHCNMLQDELQYLMETLPADANRYTPIVLDVAKLFNVIKALRQSDNRFLKHIKR